MEERSSGPKAADFIAKGKSFEEYNTAWHAHVCRNGNPPKESMYWDGQFDEIPYADWEDAGGVSTP